MREEMEDVHVVAHWSMNSEHISEINVSYFNSENELIGYVDTDAKGNMKWQIVNLAYKDYFFSVLPYLYAGEINDHISYESKEENGIRWTRMRIYLAKNNISIQYSREANNLFQENTMGRAR